MPDPVNTVVVVKTRGDLTVQSNMPSLKDGMIVLPADFADIHNPGYGTHAVLTGSGEDARITNWVDPGVRVEWMFNADEPATYRVEALLKSEGSGTLVVRHGTEEIIFQYLPTGGGFEKMRLGTMDITETGNQLLQLNPLREGWSAIELGSLVLVKE
jgi:alpha-L-fucosidase